jgi:hypothetical protein
LLSTIHRDDPNDEARRCAGVSDPMTPLAAADRLLAVDRLA